MVIVQSLTRILSGSAERWSVNCGRMHYRNSIIASEGMIYVSTAGSHWNRPDPDDAVLAVDSNSGEIIWKAPVLGDANGIVLHDGHIVGGTDGGQVFALDAGSGAIVAKLEVGEPVLARPVKFNDRSSPEVFLVTESGGVISFNSHKRSFTRMGRVDAKVCANVVIDDRKQLYIGDEAGSVLKVDVSGETVRELSKFVFPALSSSHTWDGMSVRGIGSLKIADELLIVSYVRETYDRRPPMLALDLESMQLAWHALPVKSLTKHAKDYGNARAEPVVFGDHILTTFGYNDAIHAFSLRSGRGDWLVRLDDGFFQNWASPLLTTDGRLFVPRVNGIVHEVNLSSRKVVRTISAEIGQYYDPTTSDGPARSITRELGGIPYQPGTILTGGIAATPTFLNGRLYVGGISGWLRAYAV